MIFRSLWTRWVQKASAATPPAEAEARPEHAELARLERLAEQAYASIYDAPPFSSTKDGYDDACFYFQKAIDEAARLGATNEVERLTRRLENIRGVYNSQFRGF